jgi:hypothetical protein
MMMERHKAKVAVDCDENETRIRSLKWQIKMRDDSYCLFQFFLPPALYGAIKEQGPQRSKKLNSAIRNTCSQEITAQDT